MDEQRSRRCGAQREGGEGRDEGLEGVREEEEEGREVRKRPSDSYKYKSEGET